ncbi:DUF397 domain-containing protein [Streptomyces stelliscabiei]|uniref:DUF397 domain-containing protein n=1 Tax=Streptomyces stelliscabiei TaxID=146820 RepID=UPI002FF15A73
MCDSGRQGTTAFEVAVTEQAIHVRDSKDLERRPFTVGREGWTLFVRYAADA